MNSRLPISSYLNTWLLKYIFRQLHIASFSFLSVEIIGRQYIDGEFENPIFKKMSAACGVFLIVGGTGNYVLLRSFKNSCDKSYVMRWGKLIVFKLAITLLLFTPFSKYAPCGEKTLQLQRFYLWIVFVIVSPMARYIREYGVEKFAIREETMK